MIKSLSIAVLAFAAIAAPASAAIYSNSFSGVIGSFGLPDTTTYGQVFVAPGGALTSWTFTTQDSSADGARFVVAAWGGSSISGGELYSASVGATAADANGTDHIYSGINLSLAAGSTYIAYLTVAGATNPTGQVVASGSGTSPLGGLFVFNNSGGVDPIAYPAGWYTGGWSPANLEYTAVFGTVPEPESWALMVAGFGLVGFALRRQTERRTIAA